MESLIIAQRDEFGKNASYRIRQKGFIPGVLYSHGNVNNIQILRKDFFNLFQERISESIIFNLKSKNSEKEEMMAYVKDYQLDPVTDEVIHIDLFKVTKGEKIKTAVPIIVTGTAKGIIMGGVVEWSERSVEIECLPKDLPESIGVDVTDVGVGESIHIGDLELAEELTILSNLNSVIVSVHIPKVKEEVVEEVEGEEIEGTEEDGEKSEDTSDTEKNDSAKDAKKDSKKS